MKKIILLSIFIASNLVANKLPVKTNLMASTSYNLNKISNDEIKEAGFQRLINEYNNQELIYKLNFNLLVPVNTKYVNVNLGFGTDFFISHNLLKNELYSLSNDELSEKSKNMKTTNSDSKNKQKIYDDTNYVETVANNLYLTYKNKYEKEKEELDGIDDEIAKYRNAKENYNDEKIEALKTEIEELKAKEEEYLAKADEYNDKIVEEELKAEKAREEEAKLENEMRELLFSFFFGEIEKEDYDFQIMIKEIQQSAETEKREQAEAKAEEYRDERENQKILANRTKKDYQNKEQTINYYETADTMIPQKEKRKEELQESNPKDEEMMNYYKNKKESVTEENSNNLEILNDSISKSEENKNIYYEELKKLYLKTGKTLPELPVLDPFPLTEEKEEYNRILNEQRTILDKFYSSIMNAENDKKVANRLIKYLDKEISYGADLYAVLNIDKEVYKDLKIFTNLKLGIKIKNNPIYKIANKFQEEKVMINGSEYIKPEAVKMVKIKPILNVSLGINYKNILAEINTGLNTGLIGIGFGYQW